jgi:hypothetical protein
MPPDPTAVFDEEVDWLVIGAGAAGMDGAPPCMPPGS